MSVPVITIFVRHSSGCKYTGDEFTKRCNCQKHLRWTKDGKQHRRKAGTRSWAEAENVKRNLDHQLSGTPLPAHAAKQEGQTLARAIDVFLQDKQNQEISSGVIGKYTRELDRLQKFCELQSVYAMSGLSRELLTDYMSTWKKIYPSSTTRSKVRERLSSFLGFCYDSEWIKRKPPLSKIEEIKTRRCR